MKRRQFQSPPSRQPAAITDLTCSVGHDGDQVVMIFNHKIDNFRLTEEQALHHIDGLQKLLEMLKAHKAGRQA